MSTQKARHHEKADKPRLLEKDCEIEAHQLEARELPHDLQGQAQAVCCSCSPPLAGLVDRALTTKVDALGARRLLRDRWVLPTVTVDTASHQHGRANGAIGTAGRAARRLDRHAAQVNHGRLACGRPCNGGRCVVVWRWDDLNAYLACKHDFDAAAAVDVGRREDLPLGGRCGAGEAATPGGEAGIDPGYGRVAEHQDVHVDRCTRHTNVTVAGDAPPSLQR